MLKWTTYCFFVFLPDPKTVDLVCGERYTLKLKPDHREGFQFKDSLPGPNPRNLWDQGRRELVDAHPGQDIT